MRKHCLSANHRDAILWTNASSGVGNSSAQTVDAHVLREWEGARKRSAAGGMERSGSLCGRGCQSAEAAPLAMMGQCLSAEAPTLATMGQSRWARADGPEPKCEKPLRGSKKLIAFGVLDDNGLDGV